MDLAERYAAAKRKKIEIDDKKKVYPRRYSRIKCVPCAYSMNKEECRQLFDCFCPVHFRIENVRCTQHKEYPVCRWEVDYIPENGELIDEGPGLEKLVDLILQELPELCVFLDKGLIKKEKVTIIYGVICDCKSPFFEDLDVQNPPHLIEKMGHLNI